MAHNVIEIKGDLWDFLCQYPKIACNQIIDKYNDLGKIRVKKNFGEKNSLEIIGVNEMEIAAFQFAETLYHDHHPKPKLINLKKY